MFKAVAKFQSISQRFGESLIDFSMIRRDFNWFLKDLVINWFLQAMLRNLIDFQRLGK